jgi:hypothetical protein
MALENAGPVREREFMAEPEPTPKYVAIITGIAGERSILEFEKISDAIRRCAKLESGQRGDIYLDGALMWTKAYSPGESADNTEAQIESLLSKLANQS